MKNLVKKKQKRSMLVGACIHEQPYVMEFGTKQARDRCAIDILGMGYLVQFVEPRPKAKAKAKAKAK